MKTVHVHIERLVIEQGAHGSSSSAILAARLQHEVERELSSSSSGDITTIIERASRSAFAAKRSG